VHLKITPESPPQPRRRRLGVIARLAVASSLVVGTVALGTPSASAQTYQRGPNPTQAILDADRGPFAVQEAAVTGQSGFGGGRMYYPTATNEGTYGVIAIVPGFLSAWSSMAWLGPRLASHGFVVIGIETNSILDDPVSRGRQLLAALDYAVNTSPTAVRSRIDRNRQAVAGWSMGGGGAFQAALDRPTLRATIPIAPVHFTIRNFSNLRVPIAILGGENDFICPPGTYQEPQYESIPALFTEKAYMELNNESHFFTNFANDRQASLMISWYKRFVDNDTRYSQFLCPGPSGTDIQEYRNTCPY
jgi:dienelactone hydrolase